MTFKPTHLLPVALNIGSSPQRYVANADGGNSTAIGDAAYASLIPIEPADVNARLKAWGRWTVKRSAAFGEVSGAARKLAEEAFDFAWQVASEEAAGRREVSKPAGQAWHYEVFYCRIYEDRDPVTYPDAMARLLAEKTAQGWELVCPANSQNVIMRRLVDIPEGKPPYETAYAAGERDR
jgi:hypothetical protein